MLFDPIVIVPNGYSIEVIGHRPADEASRLRLTWLNPSDNIWYTLWSQNAPHPVPFKMFGPTIPIGGMKMQIEAWNQWGENEWPMAGERSDFPEKVFFRFSVEPGQSQIFTSVTFFKKQVVYFPIDSDELEIKITRRGKRDIDATGSQSPGL